jgi:hypothetical protein
MAFDGKEGSIISTEMAAELTGNHRQKNLGQVQGYFYGKENLEAILSQEGCMGIRIYYGMNDEGVPQLVLVGADAAENDMLDVIVEIGAGCPPRCASKNALNS